MNNVAWGDIIPMVVSIIGAVVALGSLLLDARQKRRREPSDVAHTLAAATGSLGEAYERRLAELEDSNTVQANAIANLTKKVRSLEATERRLLLAIRGLGTQIEDIGEVPVIDWRKLYTEVHSHNND